MTSWGIALSIPFIITKPNQNYFAFTVRFSTAQGPNRIVNQANTRYQKKTW